MSVIVNVPMSAQRDIQTVTVEIRQLHRQGQELALRFIVEIGRRLQEAKTMLGHGQWGTWVAEELPFSQRTAANYIQVFEQYGADQLSLEGSVKSQALANLSYTKALRLLAIEDEEERESFAEAHDVAAMSTRELEQAIRERDEARQRAASLESERDAAREAAETAQAAVEEAAQRASANAEAAMDGLREDLAKAREDAAEAEALREKLQKAQEAAEKERSAAKEAREALEAAKAAADPEALEKIRAEEAAKAAEGLKAAEEKAEALRRQLAAADPDTAVFGAHFAAVQREFGELGAVYARVRENDAERAGKLKAAVRAVVDKLSRELEAW